MQDLSDSELEPELKYEGIDINNEPLIYIKEFPITPIYNTLFPNILPVDDDDFDYSDMPELISDSDSDSGSNLVLNGSNLVLNDSDLNLDNLDDLDVATESESVPSLNLDDLNLDEIKRNIESTVNFSSANEGLNALNNPDQLMNRIQGAFDSFKSQVGRNMTYSEMRQMMG
jgi:hypothetical protein